MKNFLKISAYIIVLTGMIGFTSCKKDEEVTIADPTSVLTTGTWKISDSDDSLKPLDGDAVSQVSAVLIAGFEFGVITSFKFETGGVLKLNYMDTEVSQGTWSLSADKKTLTLKDSQNLPLSTIEISEAKTGSMTWKVLYKKATLQSTSDVTVQLKLIPKV